MKFVRLLNFLGVPRNWWQPSKSHFISYFRKLCSSINLIQINSKIWLWQPYWMSISYKITNSDVTHQNIIPVKFLFIQFSSYGEQDIYIYVWSFGSGDLTVILSGTNELTLTPIITSHCNVKHIMKLPIKTIRSVLIYSLWKKVYLNLHNCHLV